MDRQEIFAAFDRGVFDASTLPHIYTFARSNDAEAQLRLAESYNNETSILPAKHEHQNHRSRSAAEILYKFWANRARYFAEDQDTLERCIRWMKKEFSEAVLEHQLWFLEYLRRSGVNFDGRDDFSFFTEAELFLKVGLSTNDALRNFYRTIFSNLGSSTLQSCSFCNGTGSVAATCDICNGVGKFGGAACPVCVGEGSTSNPCEACEGGGEIRHVFPFSKVKDFPKQLSKFTERSVGTHCFYFVGKVRFGDLIGFPHMDTKLVSPFLHYRNYHGVPAIVFNDSTPSLVNGANPDTFTVLLGEDYLDEKYVYATFYGRDEDRIFYKNTAIPNADASSFRVLCPSHRPKTSEGDVSYAAFEAFAADRNAFYFGAQRISASSVGLETLFPRFSYPSEGTPSGMVRNSQGQVWVFGAYVSSIEGKSLELFTVSTLIGSLPPCYYARDKRRVYFVSIENQTWHAVSGAHAPSFQQDLYLEFGYAKDKRHVYYGGKRVPRAHPPTFCATSLDRHTSPMSDWWSALRYFSDVEPYDAICKNCVYYQGRIVGVWRRCSGKQKEENPYGFYAIPR